MDRKPSAEATDALPDLFATSLIASYVDDRRFVPRPWLLDRVRDALIRADTRFVLITGEPGSGKSALLAHLARLHPDAPRYFVRRDSVTPLQSGDARSLLFAVGHQLAHLRPSLFDPAKLEVVIHQRAGRIAATGRVVAIEVDDLRASPFHQTSIKVTQDSQILEGDLVGISAARVTLEPRLLELSNLQYLALLDPAQALLDEDPEAQVVILIDALDEIRYAPRGEDILAWLSSSPDLPANLRFVLTCRSDPDLLAIFRATRAAQLVEVPIDPVVPKDRELIYRDLGGFFDGLAREPATARALAAHDIRGVDFADAATTRAEGNFQYAVALARGIDAALAVDPEPADLPALLRVEGLPGGMMELYRFFLGRIKEKADWRVSISGTAGEEPVLEPAWNAVFRPLLGVLAVALEPLSDEQLLTYGRVPAEGFPAALEALGQFLDTVADGRRRLYHATLPEFLTGAATGAAGDPFHVDPAIAHALIGGRLRRANPDWLTSSDRYALTYAPAHLAAALRAETDPARRQVLASDLAAILTDARFLAAKTRAIGIDAVLEDHELAMSSGISGGEPGSFAFETVFRALRRSRVALAYDPDQFATQLHGRLSEEPDPQLQSFVGTLGSVAPTPWLRLRGAAIGWRADLETTFSYREGKVRAVAFGSVGDRVLLAVGAGDQVVVRDLLRGERPDRVIDNDGRRVTALAMGTVDGQQVVVAVAGYDGAIAVRNVLTGQAVGSVMAGAVDSVAVGSLRGRPTVAGLAQGGLQAWDVTTGQPADAAALGTDRPIVGVGTLDGRLVAHLAEQVGADAASIVTVDLEHGREATQPVALSCRPNLVTSCPYPGGIAIIARDDSWTIADCATVSGPLRHEGPIDPAGRVRSIAIARVADRFVATSAPDNDLDIGYVALLELTAAGPTPPQRVRNTGPRHLVDRDTAAVLLATDGATLLLRSDPVTLVDADTGRVVDAMPPAELVARALTGQPAGDFTRRAPDGMHLNVPPRGRQGPEGRSGKHAQAAGRPARQVADADAGVGFRRGQPLVVLPGTSMLRLRADQPDRWPTLTQAWGFVGGNPVVARGSYDGVVWVQDLTTGATIAGPHVSLPAISRIIFGAKPAPDRVESVAVGEFGGIGLVAAAFMGQAWVTQLGDLASGPTVIRASSVVAVALGRMAGQNVVVTGSIGGHVGLWRADSGERIAAVTLDQGITRVWVIHGSASIAAETGDRSLVVADLIQEG